jgi:hypothetical protein
LCGLKEKWKEDSERVNKNTEQFLEVFIKKKTATKKVDPQKTKTKTKKQGLVGST